MLTPKVRQLLEKQKKDMLKFDEEEGILYDKHSPKYYDLETKKAYPATEILYDNVIKWMDTEEAFKALGSEFYQLESRISEDTLTTGAPTWTTIMLPLVRRYYHTIVARELVSIQPLKQPTAYIYYLNKLYTNTGGGVTAGQRLDQQTPTLYGSSSEGGNIREIELQILRKSIEAEEYKLKADFSLEALQDWKAVYGIDIEGELVGELGDEIAREVDRRIINALIAGVGHTINWNPSGYRTGDVNITTHRHSYEAEIYHAIVDAEAWILQNKAGVARDKGVEFNLVMNANNWARLKKLEYWNITNVVDNTESGVGRRYEGVIGNKFKVYISPEMSDCNILMAIKKDWKFATGFFAPYIPLYVSERYIRADDFSQLTKGALSRFALGVLGENPTGSESTTNRGLVLINLCVS